MKRTLYILYILLIVLVFIPKEKIFYTIESYLAQEHIYITDETLNDRLVFLDVQNARIVLDNLEVASVENIRITPWIIFNRLSLTSVDVSSEYQTFFPGKIDEMELTYSILHPLSIQIHARGDFGQCRGAVDLMDQKVRVVFDATQELRKFPMLVYKLHREEEGLVYESAY